ncbi:preprotein translocase subunit SecE [Synechococcus elongatus]|uniref:Protein translocase subunit SecE n=2 Tax=Synechococcus elongatus TaxID=32046 RepID=A0AAN1QQI2_SYNEL|nr:preprotein translocase subunit SecE [Synechococcus elongatus]AZB73527.1 preprotein translocase subunit SecE [Synechococcus elongatus PCC 11801]QFZ93186.1 preprotein translocase subunit SecE [Synechococcus elongatus PCC 11802]
MSKNNAAEKVRKSNVSDEPSSGLNLVSFLQETRAELSKVVWPSRQQLISESAAVLLMVSLSATLIYLINELFSWASSRVFG